MRLADIAADPFAERRGGLLRSQWQALGGAFEFVSESRQLLRLVRWAYHGLPRHRLSAAPPRMTIRLVLGEAADAASGRAIAQPDALAMCSAPALLCAASPRAAIAVISAERRSALVVVPRELLRFPYHVRYELIEFAVFTLAARVQGLMPLHAACVCRGRCGLLLVGESGAGKSTAVLHCALQGLGIVSEDSLFVAPRSLLATGVPNFLHVRRQSLRFLQPADAHRMRRSPTIRRRSGARKLEIDLRQLRFGLAPQPPEIRAMVVLAARTAARGPLLVPLAPRLALASLRRSQPYAASQAGWAAFAQRMRALPAFELRRGGHPRDSAEALAELLATPPEPSAG